MSENLIYGALGTLFVVLVWAAIQFYRQPSWALSILLPLTAFLIFDAGVLLIGNYLGEGELLHVLSQIRVLLRAFTFPLLIAIGFDQGKRSGSKLLADPLSALASWIIILVLVIVGFYIEFLGLELEFKDIAGNKRYLELSTPKLHYAAIVAAALVVGLGLIVFREIKKPWLMVGAVGLLLSLLALAAGITDLAVSYAAAIFGACVLISETQLKLPPIPEPATTLVK